MYGRYMGTKLYLFKGFVKKWDESTVLWYQVTPLKM
ncbi:hypothetical protein Lbys_3451 [Leadbetterella byssophila DSM 17132]|uniref:Uncharacterized protein n=1 Tax=Leadbetterella byssophila (strain DSM 17132 / JCM 16389 / KACC 11308 / NBRC 106382 / 4M15) TaxID=649349 RepID=E4RYG9_LEAB4|nr:hypothetical protein Lbys_3451 [Leadbetterella byssophila DSM 17132]